ncbi:unnamed protein product [Phyllotreta striolata]|uniref:STAS domain-containing protein n=1 Tax=Phyllotreta striolata TaxID=444603 RepID=A0A9N9TVL9_PHYSR|nr:unnamed protein product [Phyllotreta striolata]
MLNSLMKKKYTVRNNTGKVTEKIIERKLYDMKTLNELYEYEKPSLSPKEKCRKLCHKLLPAASLKRFLPIIDWLYNYNFKTMLAVDLLGGINIAMLQLPQTMACALIADIPAVNGIYTAIFPAVIYAIFGTSKQIAAGAFMAASLMTGFVVNEHATVRTIKNIKRVSEQFTEVEVAQTVSFAVALIELCMYILKLGVVSQMLPPPFLGAFTCSIAYHIVVSQFRDLLGLPTEKRRGVFSLPLTVYDLVTHGNQANVVTLGISIASCTVLLANRYVLKPWLSKKTVVPFPAAMVLVSIVTTFSELLDFNRKYDVAVIGIIPTGFPEMVCPKFHLLPDILLDSLAIVIVGYVVTVSLALVFARKWLYEIDANQELLALGASSLFGSFTGCLPMFAAVPVSILKAQIGCKTQLSAFVTSGVLLIVVLWIGPLFRALPKCILASLIIVALMDLLLEVRYFVKCWRLSPWDGVIWTTTFLTTFIFNISYGLIAGLSVSLLIIYLQGYLSPGVVLGVVPNTDLYLDLEKFKAADEIKGVKIFRGSGGLNFVVTQRFRLLLMRKTALDPSKVYQTMMKRGGELLSDEINKTNCVVLDFSNVTFIDKSGVDSLNGLLEDYRRIGVEFVVGGCSGI